MIAMIIAGITCGIFVILFLVTYLKSKGIYDEFLESVDKKEYALKDFMPIGLYLEGIGFERKIVPASVYAYLYKYNMKVNQKIIEINGIKYSDYYIGLHRANRLALAVAAAALTALLGAITAFTGDAMAGLLFAIVSYGVFFGVPFLVDQGLDDKIKVRRTSIQMEFPEFVNKMTILVNAGMTISKAWEKIAIDGQNKTSPLYTELQYTLAEISAGKPESVAIEEFGRRCKIKEIIRFVSVIVMNLKKGGAEVVPVLKMQANECWEMRKNAAKMLGEEAGTKVLMPMMIMFVGVIIIVVTPAIMNFSGGM